MKNTRSKLPTRPAPIALFTPATDAARLNIVMPNSRLEEIAGCGHVPQEECPAEFSRVVSQWIDTEWPLQQ